MHVHRSSLHAGRSAFEYPAIVQSLASNESIDTHVHATSRMQAKSSLAQSTRSYPDQVELVLYGVIERELKLCTLLHLLLLLTDEPLCRRAEHIGLAAMLLRRHLECDVARDQ